MARAPLYREVIGSGATQRVRLTAAELSEHESAASQKPADPRDDEIAAIKARLAAVEAGTR